MIIYCILSFLYKELSQAVWEYTIKKRFLYVFIFQFLRYTMLWLSVARWQTLLFMFRLRIGHLSYLCSSGTLFFVLINVANPRAPFGDWLKAVQSMTKLGHTATAAATTTAAGYAVLCFWFLNCGLKKAPTDSMIFITTDWKLTNRQRYCQNSPQPNTELLYCAQGTLLWHTALRLIMTFLMWWKII